MKNIIKIIIKQLMYASEDASKAKYKMHGTK